MLNSISIEYVAGGVLLICMTILWLLAERNLSRAQEAGKLLVLAILQMNTEIIKLQEQLNSRKQQD